MKKIYKILIGTIDWIEYSLLAIGVFYLICRNPLLGSIFSIAGISCFFLSWTIKKFIRKITEEKKVPVPVSIPVSTTVSAPVSICSICGKHSCCHMYYDPKAYGMENPYEKQYRLIQEAKLMQQMMMPPQPIIFSIQKNRSGNNQAYTIDWDSISSKKTDKQEPIHHSSQPKELQRVITAISTLQIDNKN